MSSHNPRIVDRRQTTVRHPHHIDRITNPAISTHALDDLRSTIHGTLAQPHSRRHQRGYALLQGPPATGPAHKFRDRGSGSFIASSQYSTSSVLNPPICTSSAKAGQ